VMNQRRPSVYKTRPFLWSEIPGNVMQLPATAIYVENRCKGNGG
jgi:hypothetical protein